MEDAQEAVHGSERQQHRDAGQGKDRQPLERLRPPFFAIELGVAIERFLSPLLNGPLQLRLRSFERQDARSATHRRLAFRLG